MGGTNHELQNKFAAGLKYLINEDGDILSPNISSSYYYNLIDNFETNQKVNLIIYSDIDGISNLGTSKTVLRAGAIPWGIAASQTGSGENIQPTVCFTSSNQPASDFASIFSFSTIFIAPETTEILTITSLIDGANSALQTAGSPPVDVFYVAANNPTTLLNLKLASSIYVATPDPVGTYVPPIDVIVEFQISPNGSTDWEPFHTFTLTTKNNYEYVPFELITPPFSAQIGDYFRCQITNPSPTYDVSITNLPSPIPNILCVGQSPHPTSVRGIATYSTPNPDSYWVTGSISRNVLTSSQSTFSHVYNSPQASQQNYSASGYFDFLDFRPSYGDSIRFEGSEIENYLITEIIQSGSSLCLKLDRDINNGTNINSFLIKRFQPHPGFITLDWNGSGYNGGAGFIIPEHTNNNIIKNFDNTIVKLKERGLI